MVAGAFIADRGVSLAPWTDFAAGGPHLPAPGACQAELFQTRLLRERDFHVNASLKYGEDTLLTNSYAWAAGAIVIHYGGCLHHYFQNEASFLRTIDARFRRHPFGILLFALAALASERSLADHVLLRKDGEAIGPMRNSVRSVQERREQLRRFWASVAMAKGLYGCISQAGQAEAPAALAVAGRQLQPLGLLLAASASAVSG